MSKLESLRTLLSSYGRCLVAYSGGVDSFFLAYVARGVLGDRMLAAIADTPSLPRRELKEALDLAKQFDIPLRVIKTKEFEDPNYVSNTENRCYFCKHELFTDLNPIAQETGFKIILYGENASDVGDFRPGSKAAAELGIRAPMKELGITKDEIRQFSAELGLPTSNKPQMACLSSRIPYGEIVSPKKLLMVEQAEDLLRDLGFYEVRVRHHELKLGQLARIEISPTEFPKLFADGLGTRVAEAFKQFGYTHVTVDLLGYRRGSVNEALGLKVKAQK